MPSHQRIDVSKVGDVTVVKFNDRKILDEAGILQFGAELFSLVDNDNRKILLLNFDGVEFLSSAALGKLITLDRKVKSHKGRLKMSNIRPEILDVFAVTKLNKVLHEGGDGKSFISLLVQDIQAITTGHFLDQWDSLRPPGLLDEAALALELLALCATDHSMQGRIRRRLMHRTKNFYWVCAFRAPGSPQRKTTHKWLCDGFSISRA